MIREWLEALTTPAAPTARRLGYVAEVVAIGARARRYPAAWGPHLAATRAFVERVAQGGDHLVVLGSGRLLDLPVETLAPRYERVSLVDWVHPRASRARAGRLPNVRLVEADVTGCLGALRSGAPPPVPGSPTCLDALPPPTTTLSLNLASQLPILPLQALEAWGVPAARQAAFGRALIEAHLGWLAALPGRVALVTDVRRRYTAGAQVEEEDALHGHPTPPPDETWPWLVAPEGEVQRGVTLTLEVQAWADWPASARAQGCVR